MTQRLETGNVEVEFSESGSGEEPVLLVHGGLFSDWFIPVANEDVLSEFRVVRLRRAGYVRPEDATEQLSIADRAAHCALVLEELGIERAHVCGHSSGAVISLQLALDRPDLVQSLVLLEPAPAGKLAGPVVESLSTGAFSETMAAFARGDTEFAFDLFMRTTCGDGYEEAIDSALGAAALVQAIQESPAFADEARASWEWSFGEEEAARLEIPLLAVAGTATAEVSALPPDSVNLLAALVPHTETATLVGANHLMPLEDPAGVSRLLAEFVARHKL